MVMTTDVPEMHIGTEVRHVFILPDEIIQEARAEVDAGVLAGGGGGNNNPSGKNQYGFGHGGPGGGGSLNSADFEGLNPGTVMFITSKDGKAVSKKLRKGQKLNDHEASIANALNMQISHGKPLSRDTTIYQTAQGDWVRQLKPGAKYTDKGFTVGSEDKGSVIKLHALMGIGN